MIMSLGLNLPLLSFDPTENTESLFDIVSYLKQQANAKAKETGAWIENAYATRSGMDQQLVKIANDDTKTRPEKIKAIAQLKQNDESAGTNSNTSYFFQT